MTLREFLPEVNDNQWKLVERIILALIGEDEACPENSPYTTGQFEAHIRNELRAGQRAKLTKELESEG